MAFKENLKKFGGKVKEFWKEHWKEVALVTGGIAAAGAAGFGMYKFKQNHTHRTTDETEKGTGNFLSTLNEMTAWNRDWDELGLNFEHLTHQPFGDITADEADYIDPFDGNCFIIAGPNSLYNDSPDKMEFYMLDKEGWYHRMPDDVRSS